MQGDHKGRDGAVRLVLIHSGPGVMQKAQSDLCPETRGTNHILYRWFYMCVWGGSVFLVFFFLVLLWLFTWGKRKASSKLTAENPNPTWLNIKGVLLAFFKNVPQHLVREQSQGGRGNGKKKGANWRMCVRKKPQACKQDLCGSCKVWGTPFTLGFGVPICKTGFKQIQLRVHSGSTSHITEQ